MSISTARYISIQTTITTSHTAAEVTSLLLGETCDSADLEVAVASACFLRSHGPGRRAKHGGLNHPMDWRVRWCRFLPAVSVSSSKRPSRSSRVSTHAGYAKMKSDPGGRAVAAATSSGGVARHDLSTSLERVTAHPSFAPSTDCSPSCGMLPSQRHSRVSRN